MKNKLTRNDFEGYRSQVLLSQKRNEMEHIQNDLILEWLDESIKSFPKASKPKKTQHSVV